MPRHASVVLSSRRRALAGLLRRQARCWPAVPAIPACSIHSRRHRRRRRARRRRPAPRSVPAQVKVGLILPLSAGGNAGVAGQSMRNAAEMALAEFNTPNIQLLVKDDGGSARGGAAGRATGGRRGRRDHPRAAVCADGQRRRTSGAGAQDPGHRVFDRCQCGVARRLSAELPAGVRRRATSATPPTGKRSFAALVPDNAYGTVVEAAFKQAVARRNGRLSRRALSARQGRMAGPVRTVAQAAARIDAIFIPDGADAVPEIVQALAGPASTPRRCSCSAPACGRTRRSAPTRSSTAPGTPRPDAPASAPSRRATGPATAGPGAYRLAHLRRRRADRGADQDARQAALLRRS